MNVPAYGTKSASAPLSQFTIQRRDLQPHDVQIDILFCGVCHSDLHTARNEWANTVYPCVPGHEIIGRVAATGEKAKRFKAGDIVGVGCIVDSCRTCANCRVGFEQYCENTFTGTYNGDDRYLGGVTMGGYSKTIVVTEHFVLRVPDQRNLAAVAPLLCAGITTYSPLKHWKVGEGQKVGIVGLGGLGHMGLKLAHAFGAHTALFTTSPGKAEDAKRLGADEVILSKDANQMAKHANSFDFILDCVSAQHDLNAYLNLLRRDGTMVMVGAPENPLPIAAFSVIPNRRSFAGSMIGGIPETQEMLDFCAQHKIASDVEVIPIQQINEAYERMLRSDVKYRFTIDMSSLK
jgi:alcohol dehydrogenase (NADP+)